MPSGTTRQSGARFQQRFMLFLGVASLVAIALIALAFHALLRLTPEEWRSFLWILAFYAPAMFLGTSLLNRPLYRPIVEYLDAADRGEGRADALREAFRRASDLPYVFFLNGVFWWTVSGALVGGLMGWQLESFGAFRMTVMAFAAAGGGFVCSVFVFFGLKQLAAPLRRELGGRIPDPAERQRLVRTVPLARKLRWSVTGVTFVTVVFALFLSLVHVSEPLEANAVEIQSRFLAARIDGGRGEELALEALLEEAVTLGIASGIALIDPSTGESVYESGARLLDAERLSLTTAPGRSTEVDSPNAFAWRPVADDGPLLVAVQPWDRIAPAAADSWLRFAATLLVSGAFALLLAHALSRDIASTTRRLGEDAERVAGGDLGSGDVFESEDELGELARSFERMASALRATVGRVSGAADGVESSASETTTVAATIAEVAGAQSGGVADTARAVEQLSARVVEISGSAQELNLLVEDASSSTMELGAAGEQLADTAGSLRAAVEEVSSSIQQSAQSMREVSSNAGSLAQVAEETSGSSAEMASNMREVNAAAEDSATRSRAVVETADRGREAVRQTVASMRTIQDSTDAAEKVARGLGERVREIGTIVDVIGDVADETNLLALNAAIIAAQAGEHGRAFSVVAEEIKALADRVLSSTREIETLIRSVQEETGNALDAMATGAGSVAEGVRLSEEAGRALDQITDVSRESGERMEHILGAVQEQTRASSYVVEQMEEMKRGVDAIQRATAEQDHGNSQIVSASESMREIAQQFETTTAEQARGARRIRDSLEGVRGATETIDGALRVQGDSTEQLEEFLRGLSERGSRNEAAAERMREVTRQLLAQAAALREDVLRFRL